MFDELKPLEEAPKDLNSPENNSTQEGRIKYTSQREDSSLNQEYNPLTTIIINTEADQDSDSNPSLPAPKGRG